MVFFEGEDMLVVVVEGSSDVNVVVGCAGGQRSAFTTNPRSFLSPVIRAGIGERTCGIAAAVGVSPIFLSSVLSDIFFVELVWWGVVAVKCSSVVVCRQTRQQQWTGLVLNKSIRQWIMAAAVRDSDAERHRNRHECVVEV
jgi:hypothetical protein